MLKNYLLIYSEQLATDIELLCQNIKAPSNTLFQIRKSSSSVYANIREANYGQSRADMLSEFEIALKECSETEGWLQLMFNTKYIDEETYKNNRISKFPYEAASFAKLLTGGAVCEAVIDVLCFLRVDYFF